MGVDETGVDEPGVNLLRWRVHMNIINELLFAIHISLLSLQLRRSKLTLHICIIIYFLYVKYAALQIRTNARRSVSKKTSGL